MSYFYNNSLSRQNEFAPRNVREEYNEIQRDPYKYLLSPWERANAYAPIPRLALGLGLGWMWCLYHVRPTGGRLSLLKLSGDLVLGVYWRFWLGYLIGDRIGARLFCDYRSIWCHKAADYEVRKIMRTWPKARPFIRPQDAPNSYVWV